MFTFGFNVKPKKAGGVSYDADASAFFTAASITDTTQKSAVNQLVLDLKSYNIWDKMKALYPIVGGSAGSHAVNLKTPGTYNLTFSTGWTHASTGMTPTSAYANTSYNSGTVTNNNHISFYSRTNVQSSTNDMGVTDGTRAISFALRQATNQGVFQNGTSTGQTYTNSNSTGHYLNSRTTSTAYQGYLNGVSKITSSLTAAQVLNSNSFYIGARNSNGTAQNYSTRECAFASIGDGLDDTEAANFYTAVQAYQTTLSRNV